MIKSWFSRPFWIFLMFSKCSRVRTPHPLDVIIYMLEINNQQRKKLYQTKRGYTPRLPVVSTSYDSSSRHFITVHFDTVFPLVELVSDLLPPGAACPSSRCSMSFLQVQHVLPPGAACPSSRCSMSFLHVLSMSFLQVQHVLPPGAACPSSRCSMSFLHVLSMSFLQVQHVLPPCP